MRSSLDFDAINRGALSALPVLLMRWVPHGRRRGREWVARNPTRNDRRMGSFSINLQSGCWADFADGPNARGCDVVSLYAYLRNIGQGAAARELARLLGIDP
jgi:hypothetical protein